MNLSACSFILSIHMSRYSSFYVFTQFAFSVCRAVQTDLNGRGFQQLTTTQGVELLFVTW